MKVLGIDPGYERLGIAIVEDNNKIIHSECFKTSQKLTHPERLELISNRLDEIIKEFSPEYLSIEKLFFNTNQKTAIKVAEARGLIIGTCSASKIKVYEYSPLEIKVAITGYGRSDKASVIKMIPRLIKVDKEIKYDDEFDAIACALTFFATYKFIHKS